MKRECGSWKNGMNSKHRLHMPQMLYYFAILSIGIFYFFLLGEAGPIVSDDSYFFLGYLNGTSAIYWLYQRFLLVINLIVGEAYFLDAVFIVQAVLALITSIVLAEFFRKEYELNYYISAIIFVLTLLPYGYSLPENVVTHHILTEGLAFTIFHLYILTVYKLFIYEKKRYIISGLFLSGVLVLLRSQLIVFLLGFILFVIFFLLKKQYCRIADKYKKRFALYTCLVTCLMLGLGTFVFYRVLKTGELNQFSDAITGRVICVSQYEDNELFEDETKEVFFELYDNAKERGNLVDLYKTQRAEAIALKINENTKDWPRVISDYYNEKYDGISNPDKMYKYRMRNAIVWELLEAHFGDYILLTMKLLPYSFVASIFIQPDAIYGLCHVIAMGIYITAIVLAIYAKKRGCDTKYIIPLVVTLSSILINVIATNIMFYGQQRYVVYPFGVFYISVLLEVIGIWRVVLKKKKEYTRMT